VISDASRAEPRAEFLAALRSRLPGARLTIAIATGTHGPAQISALGIPDELWRDTTIVNHDGHRDHDLVELGATHRGTPVRVHRCVVDTDLVIATGCIRPHYFAGFGAGCKAIFPGLGQAAAIRINHQLKTHPLSLAGIVDGNPCREDLEEAVSLLPTPTFLVNGVCGPDDQLHAVVAGALATAFREGAALARPWFTVHARPAALVIASDALPITASLYQAAKIAAAAAPLVEPNGVLVIVAECAEGIGPLEIVNEAIFRIGILPRLAAGVRIVLISALSRADVERTLVEYASSIDGLLPSRSDRILVLPRASHLICEPPS
jgi:nickel-dependent lactate racemase